jgi:hypothetical protein
MLELHNIACLKWLHPRAENTDQVHSQSVSQSGSSAQTQALCMKKSVCIVLTPNNQLTVNCTSILAIHVNKERGVARMLE